MTATRLAAKAAAADAATAPLRAACERRARAASTEQLRAWEAAAIASNGVTLTGSQEARLLHRAAGAELRRRAR